MVEGCRNEATVMCVLMMCVVEQQTANRTLCYRFVVFSSQTVPAPGGL
jgi:hypothetical protein